MKKANYLTRIQRQCQT